MFWSFIAVIFSGWLYINTSYRGPVWQCRLFQFTTPLLLLVLAWQAPKLTISSYMVILGILATLAGNIILILSSELLNYSLYSSFLCNIFYVFSFTHHMTKSTFWPLILIIIILNIILTVLFWSKLGKLRRPVFIHVNSMLIMIWIAIEQYFQINNNFNLLIMLGTTSLLVANSIWLVNRYKISFNSANALINACYLIGHFLIVYSLYL